MIQIHGINASCNCSTKDLCGYTGRLRDFRIALSRALTELVRVGEFSSASIDERDIAHWVRNTESGRGLRA